MDRVTWGQRTEGRQEGSCRGRVRDTGEHRTPQRWSPLEIPAWQSQPAGTASARQACHTVPRPPWVPCTGLEWERAGPRSLEAGPGPSQHRHVRLLATPWTASHQAPPSMGFSRQEYWSGVPLPSPNVVLGSPPDRDRRVDSSALSGRVS